MTWPGAATCRNSASAVPPAEQEHRLLAEQIPEPPGRIEPQRTAPGVERAGALHLGADGEAEIAEILDGAEMDVRRVVPRVRQIVGARHAATEQEQHADLPVTEIRKRHHRMAADAEHVLEHDAGM